jgi:hypothetical protein
LLNFNKYTETLELAISEGWIRLKDIRSAPMGSLTYVLINSYKEQFYRYPFHLQ